MKDFPPTTTTADLNDHPARLAEAVVRSLSRPIYYPLSWGIAETFFCTLVSAGIAPVVATVVWLRDLIPQHAQQLWYAGEWIRLQSGDPDAARMQEATKRIRLNIWLAAAAWVFALIGLVALGAHIFLHWHDARLLDARSPLLIVLGFAVTLAAVCNWIHLAWHAQNVRRCIDIFNQLAPRYELAQIPPLRVSFGLRPMWIVGGLVLSASGAIWAIPIMLAAAAHRRYTIISSARMRRMLAEQVRTMLRQKKPPVRTPAMIAPLRACIRPTCRAPLTAQARFCPRCGTAVAKIVDVVA